MQTYSKLSQHNEYPHCENGNYLKMKSIAHLETKEHISEFKVKLPEKKITLEENLRNENYLDTRLDQGQNGNMRVRGLQSTLCH